MNESRGTGLKIRDNMAQNGQIKPMQPSITEQEYYIHPRLKEDLEGIVATLSNIKRFGTVMGHRNYLLVGPPGTGKTLGVQYLATKLQCPVYDGKNVANPQQVSQLYQQLRTIARNGEQKVILMLDEVDRFSTRDDLIDPSQQQTLNQLLAEMDGVESNNGIFVFGMTNKPDKIDNALRRPGRFSKEIEVMPPDKKGREKILEIHAYEKDHQFKVNREDLDYIASRTFGYTGADLRGLLDEAFTYCILRDPKGESTEVTREDFDKALKKTKPSALRDMPFREPKKKLSDIGGYESHKEIVRRVVEKGNGGLILLYGPPGTGKSLMPEAIAGEMGYNLIEIHGNDPETSLVGATKDKLKRMIERAKNLAPCVLNFDEIGGLVAKKHWTGGTKEGHTGYLQSVLNNPPEGVYIFATENRPDELLDTFVQRFPHRLYFGMPTPEEQAEIWRRNIPREIDPRELVGANDKLSGRNIVHTALLVKDYGLEPTAEVYRHLIENIKPVDEESYKAVREEVGDSVRDYDNVRRFLDKSPEKTGEEKQNAKN